MEPTTALALDASRRAILWAAVERVIPPSDALPRAGETAGGAIEKLIASSAPTRRAILDTLTWLDLTCWRVQDQGFAEAGPEAQDELLGRAEAELPTSFALLVRLTYIGYYSDPRVVAALGLPLSPQPQGYQLPAFDPSLLDQVRQRGHVWRKVTGDAT